MYEIAPSATDTQFLLEQAPCLTQAVVLGFLCGWVAHRLVGSSVDIHGLKVFFGLAGLYAGSWLWRSFSWQGGPMVGDFSLLASLAGAIVLFACFRLLEIAVSATASSS
jgi:uncharacterized membrane protein YeaQ/YmgE (transglycosylase-associated protein family)